MCSRTPAFVPRSSDSEVVRIWTNRWFGGRARPAGAPYRYSGQPNSSPRFAWSGLPLCDLRRDTCFTKRTQIKVPRCFRWVRTVERNPKGCQIVAGGRGCETPGDSLNSPAPWKGARNPAGATATLSSGTPTGCFRWPGRSGGLADSTSGYALSTLRVESIHRMPTENYETNPNQKNKARVCNGLRNEPLEKMRN